MKIKNILTAAVLFFALLGFSYLVGSFAAWSFNPAQWDVTGRALFSLFAPILSGLFTGLLMMEIVD
jgi:hypothetical protein